MSKTSNNSEERSENDNSRSNYVRYIIQRYQSSAVSFTNKSNIPKVIVQFWDNLSRIPKDVQECLDTWETLTASGYTRLLFDAQKARNFIFDTFGSKHIKAFDQCYHPAMQCDYFRLCYILAKGGFYVDADEIYQGKNIDYLFDDARLKLQPLCYDIENETMIETGIFLRDQQFSHNWIFYFNNNPIIAPAGHSVIRLALKRATKILINSKNKLEIQSTTGPGNLTASLVRHFIDKELSGKTQSFLALPEWNLISVSPWSLGYRNDARNWRLSNKKDFKHQNLT